MCGGGGRDRGRREEKEKEEQGNDGRCCRCVCSSKPGEPVQWNFGINQPTFFVLRVREMDTFAVWGVGHIVLSVRCTGVRLYKYIQDKTRKFKEHNSFQEKLVCALVCF